MVRGLPTDLQPAGERDPCCWPGTWPSRVRLHPLRCPLRGWTLAMCRAERCAALYRVRVSYADVQRVRARLQEILFWESERISDKACRVLQAQVKILHLVSCPRIAVSRLCETWARAGTARTARIGISCNIECTIPRDKASGTLPHPKIRLHGPAELACDACAKFSLWITCWAGPPWSQQPSRTGSEC